MQVTDTVTVMRQGRVVATLPTAETTSEQLAELMVGRRVSLRVDKGAARPGETMLEVIDLVVEDGLVDAVVDTIAGTARTGHESGDGIVWTTPVSGVRHNRTGRELEEVGA